MRTYDVIIIGAGPAGLSAALVLCRARRHVLLIDAGEARNKRAVGVHGYLTRDGIDPAQLRSLGRAEVSKYGGECVEGLVTHAERAAPGSFTVRYRAISTASADTESSNDREVTGRRLLLATGMRDNVPGIDGLSDFYGTSVHHCPYCDGWEHRDQRLVAYGEGDAAVNLAVGLRTWSPRIIACTDGHETSADCRDRARALGIDICDRRVTGLRGTGPTLERILLDGGGHIECDALFFNTGQGQRSELPRVLGCRFKDDGGVDTDDRQCTGVDGLYLAGDAGKEVQFAIVAAAEGATAATAINRDLQDEDERVQCGRRS